MSVKETATDLVRSALGGEMEFLVLRGLDEFARADGDIDVLVPRGNGRDALALVSALAAESGWIVAGVRDIGYIAQVCLIDRSAEGERDRAVKIDLWDGMSWAAIGADPLGDTLLGELEKRGEAETVGLVTLLQKMLYAGYLRDRDRERIASAVDGARIAAFIDAQSVPLTAADLQAGRVGRSARWRLRAASSGVNSVGLPVWFAKAIWRKLRFAVFRSSLPGALFAVTGAGPARRAAAIDLCRTILGQSGFPEPTVGGGAAAWSVAAWRNWWAAARGETVLVDAARIPARGPLARSVPIHLSDGDDAPRDGDLDALLAELTDSATEISREARTP